MARFCSISSTEALLSYFANDLDSFPPANCSKALTLRLTLPPNPGKPPELVTNFWDHGYPISSTAEGSFQPLDNGNTLMGYGIEPSIKEYGPSGDARWSAQFAGFDEGQSYRVCKKEWHATPYTQPSLVVSAINATDELSKCTGTSSSLRGYVSWNGATDVEKYTVFVGDTGDNLQSLGDIEKKGFETMFWIPADTKVVQVAAIQSGLVVRKSEIVQV